MNRIRLLFSLWANWERINTSEIPLQPTISIKSIIYRLPLAHRDNLFTHTFGCMEMRRISNCIRIGHFTENSSLVYFCFGFIYRTVFVNNFTRDRWKWRVLDDFRWNFDKCVWNRWNLWNAVEFFIVFHNFPYNFPVYIVN